MSSNGITLTPQTIEQLPNYKKVTKKEYSSVCPFCVPGQNTGDDRFRYWPLEGNYWCRQCKVKGFVENSPHIKLDPIALAKWKAEKKEQERQELLTQAEKIEQINSSNNVTRYHQQLTQDACEWWQQKGLNYNSLQRWLLGYTTNCPTCKDHESFTIPIYYQDKLYNIRHRLASPNGSGKYRPEITGLPNAIFNADILQDTSGFVNEITLVEGEIKAMVLAQYGFDAVAIPGANSFQDKWINLFPNDKTIYIALDPGAEDLAQDIWQRLKSNGKQARLCQFSAKPDDFFTIYNGTPNEFLAFLENGRW